MSNWRTKPRGGGQAEPSEDGESRDQIPPGSQMIFKNRRIRMRKLEDILNDPDLGRYLDGVPSDQWPADKKSRPSIDEEHSIIFLSGIPVLPLMKVKT